MKLADLPTPCLVLDRGILQRNLDRMAQADLVQVEREAPAQTAARFTTDAGRPASLATCTP